MTLKDGFKLGVGIILANIAFNILMQILTLAWLYLVAR